MPIKPVFIRLMFNACCLNCLRRSAMLTKPLFISHRRRCIFSRISIISISFKPASITFIAFTRTTNSFYAMFIKPGIVIM